MGAGWGWGEGTRLHPLCSSEHLNFLLGTPDCMADCKITFFTNCLGPSNSGMRAETMYNTLISGYKSPRVPLQAYFPFCREPGDSVEESGIKS